MNVRFFCQDGSETITKTASLALMYWYGWHSDQRVLPSPYGGKFLPIMFACAQGLYGQLPELLCDFPATPVNDAKIEEIITRYDKGDVGVIKYETYCLELLKWLLDNGDIVDLQIDGKQLRNPKHKYRSIDDV